MLGKHCTSELHPQPRDFTFWSGQFHSRIEEGAGISLMPFPFTVTPAMYPTTCDLYQSGTL